MANIKIVVNGSLMDGHKITFKAPCDCISVEKLKVCYVEDSTQKSRLFTMKDAHGNDLTGLGNLFSEGAYVDVVLDTENGVAYLQNAGTNTYLEGLLRASNGVPFRFGITDKGEYGYVIRDAGGADTVYPFKNLERDTQATATAAQLTVGATAWVNGKLITGTRPAPVTAQSGSVTFMVAAGKDTSPKTSTQLVTFPKVFDKTPTVTVVAGSRQQYMTVTAKSINQSSFIISATTTFPGSENIAFSWSAQA